MSRASKLSSIYDQLAAVTAQRDALRITLASRVEEAGSQSVRTRMDEMSAALGQALAAMRSVKNTDDHADPEVRAEVRAAITALEAALKVKS